MRRSIKGAVAIVAAVITVAVGAISAYLYSAAPATVTAEPVTYSVVHHPGAVFDALVVLLIAVAAVFAVSVFSYLMDED